MKQENSCRDSQCRAFVLIAENPIKSHTLQNRKILKSIQENHHIYVVGSEITDDKTKISFNRKGVNQSTIFKCLCAEHDKIIFKEIEDKNYTGTEQQKFLFAFKALLYAYWKSQSNYNFWANDFYQKYNVKKLIKNPEFLEQFVSNTDDKDRLEKLFTKYMNIYNNGNYSAIKSFCITLDYEISFCCCCNTFISNMLDGKLIDK